MSERAICTACRRQFTGWSHGTSSGRADAIDDYPPSVVIRGRDIHLGCLTEDQRAELLADSYAGRYGLIGTQVSI